MTFPLHRFHGGLSLASHKDQSTQQGIRIAPVPNWLIFPLRQRSGRDARAWVEVGDTILRGSLIAGGQSDDDPPLHASTSGTVHAIENRPLPSRVPQNGPCIIIKADGRDDALPHSGMTHFQDCPTESLVDRIHAAGVTGLGGAGFPAAAKLRRASIDTLIINGVECEPYTSCDDSLLRERSNEVLQGAEILRHILGAQTVILAIENDMAEARRKLELAIEKGRIRGITLVTVPAVYPSGSERQLIRVVTGREVPTGSLPGDIGIITQNVGTVAAIYRAITQGEPLCSRIITVTGQGISHPCNMEVRLGTSIADLIAWCGGYTHDMERLILGGPMTGFAVPSDDLPVTKALNTLLAVGRDEWQRPADPLPCIRCGACAEVCPARLLPQQLYWHAQAQQLDRALDHHLTSCIECACCDLVCPSHIPLTQTFRHTKRQFAARALDRDRAQHARARYLAHEARIQAAQEEQQATNARRKGTRGSPTPSDIQSLLERAKQKRTPQASTPLHSDDPEEC